MSTQAMRPSLEEQRELHAAAIRLKEVAPWRWMYDSDMFGVRNPDDGEIGYCCVMGNLGEHLALAVYQGSEGLAGLQQMHSGRIPDDPLALLMLQKCLMASFEDRAQLQKADLDTIKALGLKFRGRQEWPLFRSYLPGYLPWHLTRDEARFLTLALQQADDVCLRYRDNRHLLTPPRRGQIMVRVSEPAAGGLQWRDTWREPAPLELREMEVPRLDEARLDRIAETAGLTNGILEMDFFVTPAAVGDEEGGRPFYPCLILAVDHRSGFIFDTKIVKPDELPQEFVEALLALIEQMGMIPGEIQVSRPEAFALLAPVAQALEIRLKSVRRLKALDEARQSLMDFMGR